MKILCDANMPYAFEAFSTLGKVRLMDGRHITPDDLRDVDLLLTRSTTKVNADLLRHAGRLRFYGSGVIGTDHIDIPLLESRGIPWSAAPGCNAESVAQYITTALLLLAQRHGFELRGKTFGLIGAGNVGRKVLAKVAALGLRVLVCDPPRQRDPSDAEAAGFLPFDEILPQADILSFHVPLNKNTGDPDRTVHLLDAGAMRRLKQDALVINAARGPVVDNTAFTAHLKTHARTKAVVDTWEGEPRYNTSLPPVLDVATPHIAGHSFEGKVNGTRQVYLAACRVLGAAPSFDFVLPPPPCPEFVATFEPCHEQELLCKLALATYDLPADDAAFRGQTRITDPDARADAFDAYRNNYPCRREFSGTRPRIANATPGFLQTLAGLGFPV